MEIPCLIDFSYNTVFLLSNNNYLYSCSYCQGRVDVTVGGYRLGLRVGYARGASIGLKYLRMFINIMSQFLVHTSLDASTAWKI